MCLPGYSDAASLGGLVILVDHLFNTASRPVTTPTSPVKPVTHSHAPCQSLRRADRYLRMSVDGRKVALVRDSDHAPLTLDGRPTGWHLSTSEAGNVEVDGDRKAIRKLLKGES